MGLYLSYRQQQFSGLPQPHSSSGCPGPNTDLAVVAFKVTRSMDITLTRCPHSYK